MMEYKTEKFLSFGLMALFVIGVIFISGCVQEETNAPTTTTKPPEIQQSTTNFLTYESRDYGIKINYPMDWIKREQFMGTVVMFLSPTESASDIFQENLVVTVNDLSAQPITLEESVDPDINQLKMIVTDFKLVDSSATSLAGNPAHKVVYTGKDGQYNLEWMQVWTIKDDKAYIVTYTAEQDKYSEFLGTVEEMVQSFEITNLQ